VDSLNRFNTNSLTICAAHHRVQRIAELNRFNSWNRRTLNWRPRTHKPRTSQAFGPVIALSSGSIGVEAGSIHALLDENGAGKSTLVKIVAGLCHRDGVLADQLKTTRGRD
jgi:ABC-type polysaccharide/polyol phosphate transport system ATPase subunit